MLPAYTKPVVPVTGLGWTAAYGFGAAAAGEVGIGGVAAFFAIPGIGGVAAVGLFNGEAGGVPGVAGAGGVLGGGVA